MTNREQRRFLLERLSKLNIRHKHVEGDEPKRITLARKAISEYEDSQYRKLDALREKLVVEVKVAREKVFFGTPDEALAAVQLAESNVEKLLK